MCIKADVDDITLITAHNVRAAGCAHMRALHFCFANALQGKTLGHQDHQKALQLAAKAGGGGSGGGFGGGGSSSSSEGGGGGRGGERLGACVRVSREGDMEKEEGEDQPEQETWKEGAEGKEEQKEEREGGEGNDEAKEGRKVMKEDEAEGEEEAKEREEEEKKEEEEEEEERREEEEEEEEEEKGEAPPERRSVATPELTASLLQVSLTPEPVRSPLFSNQVTLAA